MNKKPDKKKPTQGEGASPPTAAERGSRTAMSEDEFWSIIDAVRKETGSSAEDQDAFVEALRERLERLSAESVVGFEITMSQLEDRAYLNSLWAAGYLINGGCSDDGFVYFRRWVMAQGRKAWEQALANPDSLVKHAPEGDEAEFEGLAYVAREVYAAKTGRDLFADLPKRIFPPKPGGESWDEDSVGKVCPKLAKKFGCD